MTTRADFEQEQQSLADAVTREAARLIAIGYAHWHAAMVATQIVMDRRRR